MKKVAPARRWTRALAALGLILALQIGSAGAPARADGSGPPPPTASKLYPLPAPGTHRLIRIGGQEVVIEDDQGRITPVDEPPPKPTRGQNVAAAATMMAIVTGGLLLFLRRQSELTEPIAAPR